MDVIRNILGDRYSRNSNVDKAKVKQASRMFEEYYDEAVETYIQTEAQFGRHMSKEQKKKERRVMDADVAITILDDYVVKKLKLTPMERREVLKAFDIEE